MHTPVNGKRLVNELPKCKVVRVRKYEHIFAYINTVVYPPWYNWWTQLFPFLTNVTSPDPHVQLHKTLGLWGIAVHGNRDVWITPRLIMILYCIGTNCDISSKIWTFPHENKYDILSWLLGKHTMLLLWKEWNWTGLSMMTSSNGNIFRVAGHLCGEFTGLRWIHRTKASDAELWCFLWPASE